ncbi:hypothetical protein ABZU32_39150 [Sphaerisporangium sp. NPDC005288]|uniref:hypothetical protein n=1 Tax=Sphaerisporangium sp. NPDC005288 TaxID=3155114 RepID=UPI0033A557C9
MSENTTEVFETAAEAEPIEGRIIPAAAVDTDEDAEHDQEDHDEPRGGIPVAHLAAGGVSASSVLLGTLYQLVGLPGLIGGGVLAGAGAVAVVRRRVRQRQGRTWGTSWEDGRPGRAAGRRSGRSGDGLLGALRSEGRSGRASRSGGFGFGGSAGGRSSRPGGRAAAAPGGTGRAAKSTAAAGSTSRRGRTTTDRAGASARNFGRAAARAAGVARAGAAGARRAAAWADGKTGGRAGRAAHAAGRAAAGAVRKAGAWADRATGRRVSAAYRAATTGKDQSFRGRRRRAAAVLGWHGVVTGPLLALVAVLAKAWRRRKTRKAAPKTETETGQAAESAGAAPGDSTDSSTGKTGQPAITATAQCPRCGATHTATLAADADEVTVTCDCGFRIRFFRQYPEPPKQATNTTASTGSDQRRSRDTDPSADTRRSRPMSANPLAAAAAELNAVAAAHAPADMWQVARELDQLVEIPANVGMALRTYTVRLQGEYPIDPAVIEALGQLYAAHSQLVAMAEEIGPLFRTVHAEDLKREEAPRTNEQAWNV